MARVLITRARGSTPREAGAAMLVTARESRGTIGGGTLEWEAAARARALLAEERDSLDLEMPLGPALGQCCGGHVSLRIERADGRVLREMEAAEQAEQAVLPLVLMFGAGHVGQALARALAPLPLRLRWIDGRAEEFGPTIPDGVEAVVTDAWEGEIARAPAGAACLVLTHSHALDARITAAALERGDLAYVGLIGSRSKRRRFERALPRHRHRRGPDRRPRLPHRRPRHPRQAPGGHRRPCRGGAGRGIREARGPATQDA